MAWWTRGHRLAGHGRDFGAGPATRHATNTLSRSPHFRFSQGHELDAVLSRRGTGLRGRRRLRGIPVGITVERICDAPRSPYHPQSRTQRALSLWQRSQIQKMLCTPLSTTAAQTYSFIALWILTKTPCQHGLLRTVTFNGDPAYSGSAFQSTLHRGIGFDSIRRKGLYRTTCLPPAYKEQGSQPACRSGY